MKTDARRLSRARLEVRAALAVLVDPRTLRRHTDAGWQTHTGPSLITQLYLEIGNSSNHGFARRHHAPIPINAEAHDLLTAIAYWANTTTATVEPRIRTVVAELTRGTDAIPIVQVTEALTGWALAITALLNPLRRYHLAKPCPRCHALMTWRDIPNGERVQVHALTLDSVTGALCLACGASWPATHLEHLARVLGCEPLPGAPDLLTLPHENPPCAATPS